MKNREITLDRFGSIGEMKADSYRYWRLQPPHARLAAVADLNAELYALKGISGDAPRLQELFACLNAEQVRYLVVGGYAVSLHAEPRATKDLDIFVDPSPKNGAALFRALAAFGAPLEGLTPESLVRPGSFFRMGVPPMMIDILPEIAGVDFDEVWPRRVDVSVEHSPELKANFISASDLITAKIASGRPQDIADAYALRTAATEDKA